MRYHIEDLQEMATPDLQHAYKNATGCHADRRWSDATIIKKMQEHWAEADEAKVREQERLAQEEADANERATRIEQRGPLEEFVRQSAGDCEDADERSFLYAMKSAARTLDQHAEKARKLGDEYRQWPDDCLTWADKYFEHAARHYVARQMADLFEYGSSVEHMVEDCRKEMLRAAGSRNRSTSFCSNVMEEERRKAWTEMYCRMANDHRW